MSTEHDTEFEPQPASSPIDHVLQELQLYGYRPFQDEPDPRPLPEGRVVAASIADIFDALLVAMADTRLEPDLEELLWGTVNLFHRATKRIERELDENDLGQRRLQREQDGSEVKSVELERLIAQGQTLLERRNAFELMRDQAAEHFERHTHSIWRPHSGSKINHRHLTAAMIDSRDFLAAKKAADNQLFLPPGPKVAFTGGLHSNDHRLIWDKLDQIHAKHPDMVLLHGGSPKGAELIAAKWACQRNVPQVAFKPDWTRHAKAAPFKRNDAMLETMPIGVVHFPGTGIQDNLADKARRLGIPVMSFGAT
jgi:YspA, cpYpsA-related SLOG family